MTSSSIRDRVEVDYGALINQHLKLGNRDWHKAIRNSKTTFQAILPYELDQKILETQASSTLDFKVDYCKSGVRGIIVIVALEAINELSFVKPVKEEGKKKS